MKKQNKNQLFIYVPFFFMIVLTIFLNAGCSTVQNDMYGIATEQPEYDKPDEIWIFSLKNNEFPEKATFCQDFGKVILDNGLEIEAESISISGDVTLLSADISIKNQYKNPLKNPTGAVYELKYSSAALITGFILTIGEKKIRAVIAESKDAERIYALTKKQGLRASIAESKNGIFKQKINNIPPNANFAIQTDFVYIPPFKENKFYLNIGSIKAGKRKVNIDLTFPGEKEIRILEFTPNVPGITTSNKTTVKATVEKANKLSIIYESATPGKLLFFDTNQRKKSFFAFLTNKKINSLYKLKYPESDYSWVIGEYKNGIDGTDIYKKNPINNLASDCPSIHKIWAGIKISSLIKCKKDPKEIIDLSVKNQILTPYTSFMAIDASGK